MLGRWIRAPLSRLVRPLLELLARAGCRPDALTMLGVACAVGSGAALACRAPRTALALLFVAGAFDVLDGAVARVLGAGTPRGGFVDSIADHVGDFAINFGLLWAALGEGAKSRAVLVFAAQFGSLFGSHVRSRALALGLELRDVGFFTRTERVLTLMMGLMVGQVTAALALVVLCANLSAGQRVIHVLTASLPAAPRDRGEGRRLAPPG